VTAPPNFDSIINNAIKEFLLEKEKIDLKMRLTADELFEISQLLKKLRS